MDWRSIRFDWNHARAFLVAAEEGSFSAAARALDVAQPTIGRQIGALEQELNVALFERTGHTLSPTSAGLDLLEHVRGMGEAANRMSMAAAGQSLELDGTVCITAGELIAAYLLPPMIERVRRLHPGIQVEIAASNSARDLTRREADIAIRNFSPNQPDLITRNLGVSRARLYASSEYVQRLGNPTTPAQLSKAVFFGFDHSNRMIEALSTLGLDLTPDNFPIITDNHLVQWELAKQGAGICIAMEVIGDAEPRVRRVIPDLPSLPVPLWLTTHRELRTSRRIRVVYDLLAEGLARCAGAKRLAPKRT